MSAMPETSAGPWYVCRGLFTRDFGVIRNLYTPGNARPAYIETLRDKRGRERRFPTEAKALAAIARTGQTPPAPKWEGRP